LPSSDLDDAMLEHFFYMGLAAEPAALVGLELFGEVALLRSLVVAPDLRSGGTGSALVAHVERHARERGVRALYLLTTTAEKFFAGRGYRRVDREAIPDPIRSTREFADLCPATAAIMVKAI
jgi:amino-acid N-acetyltransferase